VIGNPNKKYCPPALTDAIGKALANEEDRNHRYIERLSPLTVRWQAPSSSPPSHKDENQYPKDKEGA
jgi:hypothetical protein